MSADLRKFLSLLRKSNQLIDVRVPVDPNLELAEIHRRVIGEGGGALLFHKVLGSPFPVVTNLFGTKQRVDLAFSSCPKNIFKDIARLISSPPSISSLWRNRSLISRCLRSGKRKVSPFFCPLKRMVSPDLNKIPMIKSWPEDGGHFVTLPLVYTRSPLSGKENLGMYRLQRFDSSTLGLHFQIQKGGGAHLHEAEQLDKDLPVGIFISGNPFLILSAITPLPESISELLFCSFLQNKKMLWSDCEESILPIFHDAEFAFFGESVKHLRRLEGPFGDHYGYYSLAHNFPIFKCHSIYHRKNAIYPATVVGKPKQEDFFLGEQIQEYLAPLISLTMPSISSLHTYAEAGFHCVASAVVKERYYKEALVSAFRILGEGQLSLTKFLLLTDFHVELKNFQSLLTVILERCVPHKDLIVFSDTSIDTLDYTGTKLNKGSKAILMGLGAPKRTLPTEYQGPAIPGIVDLAPYSPGCLVLQGTPDCSIPRILDLPSIKNWPLVVLTDNVQKTVESSLSFLWHVFTRFAPATDLHVRIDGICSHRPMYTFPFVIDARMKPHYPKEVEVDPDTYQLVSSRWRTYFS
ncbi:UbiD family decarboxylase [Chlamydiifrater phoenicopteri]|uniref:UbiD family decarboxylase n=1 Tax=Chlamydiifrater phoenicopteri TaxID=2681469 RepID=UPI001BCA9AA2|nr:UbiD family decarboxylase [Chlamydiifrater phoenicopteri]